MMAKKKLKLGYLNARDILKNIIAHAKKEPATKGFKKEIKSLEDVLNDFEYCIEKTEKFEAVEAAFEALKEALK